MPTTTSTSASRAPRTPPAASSPSKCQRETKRLTRQVGLELTRPVPAPPSLISPSHPPTQLTSLSLSAPRASLFVGAYAPVYNPGGPGPTPAPGVNYTNPSPYVFQPVMMAIDDPFTVTVYDDAGGKDADQTSPTADAASTSCSTLATMAAIAYLNIII